MHLKPFRDLSTLTLAALACACVRDPDPAPSLPSCSTKGCDTEEQTSPDDETPPDDVPEIDDEAPRVVQVTPPDGATGVGPVAMIMIKLSEPMDPASTEAAYRSAELAAEAVTMAWNAVGDTLTIAPKVELEFGEGHDPESAEALRYSFELTTTAQDVAGNALAEPLASSFETLRRVRVPLAAVADWTGSAIADDPFTYRDDCTAGDNIDDATVKILTGFDLAELPDELVKIESGHLIAEQRFVTTDDVYDDLGTIVGEQVAFEVFDEGFSAEGSEIGVFSRSPELGRRQLPVSAALAQAYAGSERKLQLRLAFETNTDHKADSDLAFFDFDSLTLEVAYLLP